MDESKPTKDVIEWIKERYSKKIEKLRPSLQSYEDKLIIINNYEELDNIIAEIDLGM